MSPELLADIRALYDAMARRDEEALREIGRRHPGFEWHASDDEPIEVTDGPLTHAREVLEAFDRLETEFEQQVELGSDAVILLVRHRVRGAASGAEVDRREAHLWRSRDGRIESLHEYRTLDEALAAARGENAP